MYGSDACSFFLGLQMWLNMKHISNQLYNFKSMRYTIGITGQNELVDQKRNVITIRPGRQTAIKVIPRLVRTSADHNNLPLDQRRCKLSEETDGLQFVTNYTRLGCETDCAIQKAISICKCLPWHYPNDFKRWPMCDMFQSHCFEEIMSVENNYLQCKFRCLKDCHETEYILLPAVYPISYKTACHPTSFLYKHFEHNFRQHYAFLNYKILVKDGIVPPDMTYGLSNGTFCREYFENYVAFVTVYSPLSAITLTERNKSLFLSRPGSSASFFYDILSTLGGHFGLFCGTSLIGVAEIIILMISLLYQICKKIFCPIQTIQKIDEPNYDEKIERMDGNIEVSKSDV